MHIGDLTLAKGVLLNTLRLSKKLGRNLHEIGEQFQEVVPRLGHLEWDTTEYSG